MFQRDGDSHFHSIDMHGSVKCHGTSMFRRRHENLTSLVSKVDGFMKFSNVGGFVCHIANIIILLYSVIFFQEERPNVIRAVKNAFWLSINVKGLMLAAISSIVVNHMVSKRLFAMLYTCM